MGIRLWFGALGLALCVAVQPALGGDLSRGIAEYRRGNYEVAIAILKPLAHRGNPYAQFSLAAIYDEGLGLPQNYSLALKWYLRAAENGLVDAHFASGMYYSVGRGMKQNPPKGYYWLNIAAAGGHSRAERARDQEMNELSRSELNHAQDHAVAWIRKHPRRLYCGIQNCIHASWLPRSGINIFDNSQW